MRILVLVLFLLGFASPVHAEWREAESRHFLIYSAGSEKELLKHSVRLESVHYLLGLATGAKEQARITKVRIFLVSDLSAVKRLYGNAVAGFYNPSERGAYAVAPRDSGNDGSFTSQVVLFHEYAHHFMLQYLPAAYPAWFVEGFAEIVSTASFERPGLITYGKAASHRQAELIYGKWYETSQLLDGSYRKAKRENRAFYGQSWLLTHYLTFSDKRPGQLRQFISAMNRGETQTEAAKVFGDLTQLQRELRIYFEGGSFPYRAPPLPAGVAGETQVRVLSATESAFIDERIELDRVTELPEDNGKDKNFKATLEKATADRAAWLAALRLKVARYANEPDALQILADAECASEDHAACLATADKMLALAPDRPRALLHKANAMLHLLEVKDNAERAAKIEVARALIMKANWLAPDDPLPLIAYYRSYLVEGMNAPDVAIDGLVQAMLTIPQVSSVRLMLATELIKRKRNEQAKIVLEPLAFSPHESESQKTAQGMLDRLNAKPVEADDEDSAADQES